MSCCAPASAAKPDRAVPDPSAWVRDLGDGLNHLDLLVPGMHCGGCIQRIETGVRNIDGVERARVNLSTRRVAVDWRGAKSGGLEIVGRIAALGYRVQPFDAAALGMDDQDAAGRELLRALAVAGFAAANVMLLSVSVWSGAEAATRDLFHWISALIALPAVAYAGRPFFRSAWQALRHRGLNMDVPISLAVLLAAAMSLYETSQGGAEAYFDASVTLLFFLLIGRYLDHRLRARARSAVSELMALNASGATLIRADGTREFVALADIPPGARVGVAAGERIPVDGTVIRGASEIDRSLVTGESLPEAVGEGDPVHAGCLNLNGPLEVAVTASGEDSFLADVIRLMEQAEQGKAGYVAIADRFARIYAPAVHVLAAATFIGWLWATGGDWNAALFAAVAVLIITCPCALGLAVPVVQVVASGLLFRSGVMVKEGAALEKLAEVDSVIFDKTGTLTVGRPRLIGRVRHAALARAASLARHSTHPLSVALAEAADARGVDGADVSKVAEVPGSGLEGEIGGMPVRLGRAEWCGAADVAGADETGPELWFRDGTDRPLRFAFEDAPRADAARTVARLKAAGLRVELLSGDREGAVRHAARMAGIDEYAANARPSDKVARLEALRAGSRKVLMVGDGINDAPALAAAHVSMSPGGAAEVSQTAASFVFLDGGLGAVADTYFLARRAMSVVRQNFGLALAYNLVAVPLAVLGYASPLIAAIAMSSSSLLVTGNALRLRLGARGTEQQSQPAGTAPKRAGDEALAERAAT